MNYSKTIREYCLQNEGRVLDISYELSHHFSMVPYKTFLKILNRLEEEKILKKYSKGIYLINKNEKSNDEDPTIAFYANTKELMDVFVLWSVGEELFLLWFKNKSIYKCVNTT